MLDSLRKPLFFIAFALLLLTVLIELGSTAVLGVVPSAEVDPDLPTPGYGIPYLALLDWLVLYTISLMGASLVIPERVHGRIQGIVTLVVSLLTLIGAIAMLFLAITLLALMVSLLLAVPFGTAIYLGTYGHFDRAAAAGTLSVIMLLKLAFAGFLVFSHQRFLQNKGLVAIVLCSLLATVIVSFLHGFFPRFLVSITDDIAAIVVAILAAIWAIFFLFGSIPAVIKALRVDRALT